MTVALVGDLTKIKGGELLERLLRVVDKSQELNSILRFVVCGKPHFSREKFPNTKIIFREDYSPENLVWFLADADVFLSLSISPETYMLTGDEVLWAGLPAVSGPLGAFSQRVKENGFGWIKDAENISEMATFLRELATSRSSDLIGVMNRLADWKPSTFESVFSDYRELYSDQMTVRLVSHSAFSTEGCSVASMGEVQLPKAGEGVVYDILKSLGFAFLKERYPRLWQSVRLSILRLPAPLRNGFFAKAKKLRVRLS